MTSIAEVFNASAGHHARYADHDYFDVRGVRFLEVGFKVGSRAGFTSHPCDRGEEAAASECGNGAKEWAQIKARAA